MISTPGRRAIHQLSKELHRGTIFTELLPAEISRPLIKCRDRPYLAGSKSKNFPEYLSDKVNPYFQGVKVNERSMSLPIQTIGEHLREFIDKNIENKSAFLLRGLPYEGIHGFQDLIRSMNYESLIYDAGIAARKDVAESLYTASDEPPEISIEAHNEMSYLEKYPSKVISLF